MATAECEKCGHSEDMSGSHYADTGGICPSCGRADFSYSGDPDDLSSSEIADANGMPWCESCSDFTFTDMNNDCEFCGESLGD